MDAALVSVCFAIFKLMCNRSLNNDVYKSMSTIENMLASYRSVGKVSA